MTQEPYSVFLNLIPGYTPGMEWVTRLNERFAATGWSKTRLAKESGVPYDNVLKYLAGSVAQPRGDQLEKLANALGTTEAYLRGLESSPLTTLEGFLADPGTLPAFAARHPLSLVESRS